MAVGPPRPSIWCGYVSAAGTGAAFKGKIWVFVAGATGALWLLLVALDKGGI